MSMRSCFTWQDGMVWCGTGEEGMKKRNIGSCAVLYCPARAGERALHHIICGEMRLDQR